MGAEYNSYCAPLPSRDCSGGDVTKPLEPIEPTKPFEPLKTKKARVSTSFLSNNKLDFIAVIILYRFYVKRHLQSSDRWCRLDLVLMEMRLK